MSIYGNPVMLGGSGGGGGGSTNVLSGTTTPTAAQGSNGAMYLLYSKVGVKNTGGQYVNTGYRGNGNSKYVIDFMLTVAQTSEWACPFGARPNASSVNSASLLSLAIGIRNYTKTSIQWGSDSTLDSGWPGASDLVGKTVHVEISAGLGKMSVDGISLPDYVWTPTAVTDTTNISLFAVLTNGTYATWSYVDGMILFGFEIYENNVLVHKFVPAKDQNDTVCLYDEITQEYKYPNSGTLSWVDSNSIIASLAKVNGAWQDLIGTDIDDIDLGGGGGGVTLMTRAEWNALSISEKQQYGLVGVEDANTGYYRGTLYYGADYDLKGEAEATSYCRLSTAIGDGASFSGRYFTRTSNEPVIFCGNLGSNGYNSYCVISTSSTAPAETHNSYGDLVPGGTITVQGVTLYVYTMSGKWAQSITNIQYTYEGTTLHFTNDAYIKSPTTSGAECTVGGGSAKAFMVLLEMYAEG